MAKRWGMAVFLVSLGTLYLLLSYFDVDFKRFAAFVFLVSLFAYVAVELGWGGGDPNHKDANNPRR